MNISPKNKSVVTYYDQLSDQYATRYGFLIPKTEYIKKSFSFLKGSKKTLEIGSGSGCDAQKIIQYSTSYIGLDISSKMVALSSQKIPEANFINVDIESYVLPYSVDIVFAFASLFHLCKSNLKKLLHKLCSGLENDGIIVITLKEGDYHSRVSIQNNLRIKTYFYNPVVIKNIIPKKLKIVYQDSQMFNGQRWLCLFLQKI